MSFLRRIFGSPSAPIGRSIRGAPQAEVSLNALVLHGPAGGRAFPVEVVGESHYQDALWSAVGSRRAIEGRRHHTRAVLVPDPTNAYDTNAIAVFAETSQGFKQVGHLPRDLAMEYADDFAVIAARGYGAGACDALIAGGAPQEPRGATRLGIWLHLDEPGAVVPDEDEEPRAYEQEDRTPTGSVRTGESRTSRSQAGVVRGKHYTDWVEDIKALKRHKANEECRALLQEIIDAVEVESTEQAMSPAPWYYEQLAIVLRKDKDFDGEVAVIERYLAFPHPTSEPLSEMRDRLTTAIAKRDRSRGGR